MNAATEAIDRAFYELVVKERNYEQLRSARMEQKIADLTAERDRARDLAARLEAQLAAIADLHAPFGIYDECACDDKSTAKHLKFDEFATCLPPDYLVCKACCTGDGYQTEECATNHVHGEGVPRCATAAILDGAS